MIAKLRELRKAKGMTQEELAKASNIHRVTISKYEAQKIDPSIESAGRLANVLGCTIEDLIGEKGA